MTKQIKFLLFFIMLTATVFPTTGLRLVSIGSQILESGESLNIEIEIRTAGKLNPDSSNVILMPTAFGQTTEDILRLTESGKLADSTKYYVVLLGALGNGVSTSPSNSKQIENGDFPQFTVKDMVRAQRKAIDILFGFSSVHAIIGGSLGGMQALEWTVLYPDLMKKTVVYVSTPKMTTPDIFHLSASSELIRQGWASGQSDIEIGRTLAITGALNARTPSYWNRTLVADAADEMISRIQEIFISRFKSVDHYSQLQAILSHDITDSYSGSLKQTAKSIRSEMLAIISEQDHSVNPDPMKKLANLMEAKTLILDNDCGHYAPSCEKPLFYRTINTFLEK